jgi:hypothetical protein
MIRDHHISKMLVSERVADLHRETELLGARGDLRGRRPQRLSDGVIPRRRVHLPIIVRGVARLEAYHRQGGQP